MGYWYQKYHGVPYRSYWVYRPRCRDALLVLYFSQECRTNSRKKIKIAGISPRPRAMKAGIAWSIVNCLFVLSCSGVQNSWKWPRCAFELVISILIFWNIPFSNNEETATLKALWNACQLGGMYIRRRQNFRDFWPPLPPFIYILCTVRLQNWPIFWPPLPPHCRRLMYIVPNTEGAPEFVTYLHLKL